MVGKSIPESFDSIEDPTRKMILAMLMMSAITENQLNDVTEAISFAIANNWYWACGLLTSPHDKSGVRAMGVQRKTGEDGYGDGSLEIIGVELARMSVLETNIGDYFYSPFEVTVRISAKVGEGSAYGLSDAAKLKAWGFKLTRLTKKFSPKLLFIANFKSRTYGGWIRPFPMTTRLQEKIISEWMKKQGLEEESASGGLVSSRVLVAGVAGVAIGAGVMRIARRS